VRCRAATAVNSHGFYKEWGPEGVVVGGSGGSVKAEMRSLGIALRTLTRARERLGVGAFRSEGRWYSRMGGEGEDFAILAEASHRKETEPSKTGLHF
jgi:hypothetical protein